MAKPIADDYNAVDPSEVVIVLKPEQPESWSLYVQTKGASTPAQLRFVSQDTRDDFYKRLVDAMVS